MNLPAKTQTYHVFNNGPVYRNNYDGSANIIDFSSYKQLEARFRSRSFSIKYVIHGAEEYQLQNRNYSIGQGSYLLTNAFTAGRVVIDSPTPVKGICIELSPGLLEEVWALNHDPSSPFPNEGFYEYLTTADFFENKCRADKTCLGRYLEGEIPLLTSNGLSDQLCMGQFFYGLAENMIAGQKEMYGYFRSFESVKGSTKKDLLGRLLKGKELMDDNYTDKLGISEIARAATMSEYYFLRLFKKTFNCSPHRYLVDKRLQKAVALLPGGHESIAGIAYQCGFADIHAFSKAFKSRYGKNPSEMR